MPRFVFFTKTSWDEPPRLRHQLARLLCDAGHNVVFFEKPLYPWSRESSLRPPHGRIQFRRHCELLHHKLRLGRLPFAANAAWTIREITRASADLRLDRNDVVVNFNYDYAFLRKLFPGNRIITIINDNFWCRAALGYERPLKKALERTCSASDTVLTVSPPLMRQLREYCEPQLFLPWTTTEYRRPAYHSERNTLLFWGFINRKIDFPYVRACARHFARERPEMKLLFVGPVEKDAPYVQMLKGGANIEVRPAEELDRLQLDHVVAGLIPYRDNVEEIDAIYLPNKALPLLVRGLPLIVHGMPNFLEAPFVFRMEDPEETAVVDDIRVRFCALQTDIEAFTAANTAPARLNQFLSYVA